MVPRLTGLQEDLLTLLRGRELHGLGILVVLRETCPAERALHASALYPVLYTMEAKGWVVSWWGVGPWNGLHRRKYYRVTTLGEELLATTQRRRQQLARWIQPGSQNGVPHLQEIL